MGIHDTKILLVLVLQDGTVKQQLLDLDEPWRVLRTKWRVDGTVKGVVEGGGRASGYFTGAPIHHVMPFASTTPALRWPYGLSSGANCDVAPWARALA